MPDVQPLTNGDPRRLGAYEVTGRLGEGGQGVVYLGRGATGQVAIKLLHPRLLEDPGARARFVREVEVTKRVARFCTAQVLDAGMAGDRPYIVSEYVPGPSLQQQLKREGPRQGAALDRLAINTATALAAIHQAGVVHRDFKPGNVLMGPDGPVVIDFGIARALDASGTTSTATSQLVGTPAFMAPEQLAEGRVGPATDMFAWGVTMVFAANGVPAFGNQSIPNVIHRILHDEPDLGVLEGRLRDLVAATLAKDPARRPTARQLMDELMGHGAVRLNAPGAAPGDQPGPGDGTALLTPGPGAGNPGGTRPPEPGPPGGVTERMPPAAMGTGGATEVLPAGGAAQWPPAGGGTERLPAAGDPQGPATRRLPPYAEAGPATRRLPSYGEAGPATRRLPSYGEPPPPMPPAGPQPHAPAGGRPPAGPPPYRPPSPAKRGAGGVIAALVAAGVLVLGIGVVWAATRSGDGSKAAAAPTQSTKRHHPTKRRRTPSHQAVRRPSPARAATPKRTVRANPYTAERLCGDGFHVIDRHPVGAATAYLLYNNGSGANCVVTMVARSTGKTYLSATLQVQGGGQSTKAGMAPFYAGPIRLPAKGKCVQWGGASKTARWLSGWSHCGS